MEIPELKRQILNTWSFLEGIVLTPINPEGTNTTFLVNTEHHSFILKIYAATTAQSQIDYEHRLLTFLKEKPLSFAVSPPLPTDSGKTLVNLEREETSIRVALFTKLSGEPPNRQNLEQVQAIGSALAELHSALSEFNPNGQLAHLPYWGSLNQIHPLIPNPLAIPEILNLVGEEKVAVDQMLTDLMESVPVLYKTLPMQTIHADFITPNILVNGTQVVAVLDFEFATYDLRLLDCLGSLNQLALFPWREKQFEPIIRAFSSGYEFSRFLSQPEKEAIITLWRLQRVSALVYWTGWVKEGKVNHEQIRNAVLETLRFETWLNRNRSYFLDCFGLS